MFKKFKINNEIFALGLLIIITIIFTSYYNSTKSKISNFLLKNEKIAEGIAKMHPLKRLGEGSDSSAAAHFLLSEDSSWITGQILKVDGGISSIKT